MYIRYTELRNDSGKDPSDFLCPEGQRVEITPDDIARLKSLGEDRDGGNRVSINKGTIMQAIDIARELHGEDWIDADSAQLLSDIDDGDLYTTGAVLKGDDLPHIRFHNQFADDTSKSAFIDTQMQPLLWKKVGGKKIPLLDLARVSLVLERAEGNGVVQRYREEPMMAGHENAPEFPENDFHHGIFFNENVGLIYNDQQWPHGLCGGIGQKRNLWRT